MAPEDVKPPIAMRYALDAVNQGLNPTLRGADER